MANIDVGELEDFLLNLFDTSKSDADDRKISEASQRKIDAIMGHVRSNDLWTDTVEVIDARAAVETVQAYNLEIGVDANGNAVTVHSPYGFHLDA